MICTDSESAFLGRGSGLYLESLRSLRKQGANCLPATGVTSPFFGQRSTQGNNLVAHMLLTYVSMNGYIQDEGPESDGQSGRPDRVMAIMSESDPNDKTQSYIQLQKDIHIGHYRIISLIGAGGMGEVYLAEDIELKRQVALKLLPAHLCQSEECRARFRREAQAAAGLCHPNIVTIYEVGEYSGRPYIAMEYVEGRPLQELIRHEDSPLSQLLHVAVQVCEGLQAAHEAGIAHRDIKPSNILIDSHGRARIVDFGLASILGTDRLTKTGSTLGTVGYMSPEQVRGEGVDCRTDIFSLGVVLYELITGKQPFRGNSDIATSRNILDAEPEPLARYKSGVSPDLQRIVSKALAKGRDARYQHVDDLAADLRQLVLPSDRSPSRPKAKGWLPPMVITFLILATVVMILRPWRMVTSPSRRTPSRIVVVPFRNQTGDTSLDPLGRMIADWSTQSLIGTGLAEIVSPEAVLGLEVGSGIRAAARATGATVLVTGSYYRIGDSLQFRANISNAEEKLLQAIDPIYVQLAESMQGIEAVRQRVTGALAILLEKHMENLALADIRPPRYDAYQEYIQGLDESIRLSDWSGSLEHFTHAYALDTTFLTPLLFAASAYGNTGQPATSDSLLRFLSARKSRLTPVLQIHLEWIQAYYSGALVQALEAARRGASLAPGSLFEWEVGSTALELNRPHESIEAYKRWNFDAGFARNWEGNWIDFGEAHHLIGAYEKELEISREGRKRFPNSYEILNAELTALAALGKSEDINRLIDEVLTWPTKPGSTPAGSMRIAASELRAHGHEAEALALLDRGLKWYEERPTEEFRNLRGAYAATLYAARRWDEAKAIVEQAVKDSPNDIGSQVFLGLIAARRGDREMASMVSKMLENLSTSEFAGTAAYTMASIAAIVGDTDQAVSLIRESLTRGQRFHIGIHRDFDFELLWDYPPFLELMKPRG